MSILGCESVSYDDVLHDVNLEVQPRRVCALLGPSGAGKTTLLWLLARLWQPSGGRVTAGAGALGMVFQQPGLWDHLTAEQHLRLVGADEAIREHVLSQMNLTDLRRRKPTAMSGGERQRLSIARALAVEPAWLLLDEPMAHLDGPARRDLFDLLRAALRATNAGVLLATHHATEAMQLADDVAVLIDGRIAQNGPAAEVYRRPANRAVADVTGMASTFNGRFVRPEDLSFAPAPGGDATVRRSDFAGHGYLLTIDTAQGEMLVWSEHSVPADTAGRIEMKSPASSG